MVASNVEVLMPWFPPIGEVILSSLALVDLWLVRGTIFGRRFTLSLMRARVL